MGCHFKQALLDVVEKTHAGKQKLSRYNQSEIAISLENNLAIFQKFKLQTVLSVNKFRF